MRVQGCVHTELVEEYGPELAVGAVLLLAKARKTGLGGVLLLVLGGYRWVLCMHASILSAGCILKKHIPDVSAFPLEPHTPIHKHTGGHPPERAGGAALAQHRPGQPSGALPAAEPAGGLVRLKEGGGGMVACVVILVQCRSECASVHPNAPPTHLTPPNEQPTRNARRWRRGRPRPRRSGG